MFIKDISLKKFAAWLAILIIKSLALIPFSSSQAIGQGIGSILYRFRTRAREVSRVNINMAYPELKETEKEQLIKQSLLHSGMTSAEMGSMWGRSPEYLLKLACKVHNLEALLEHIKQPNGLILFAPHQSNWEILNNTMVQYTNITAMYKPLKNAHLNQWMITQRAKTGMSFVPTTRAGVESLFDVLNNGGTVGFLPDQEPKPERGEFAPFYEAQALTPKLPYELIQKTGCKVLFACAIRLEHAQGFEVHLIEPDAGIYSEDEVTCLTALNKGVQACIDLDNTQYNWAYKRFKHQPDGAKNPYDLANVP